MKIYVCINKQTCGNNQVYLLRDIRNNEDITVSSDLLKESIRNKSVDVLNLTLTSDNRLVEASRDKIAQLGGILNAPESIRGELTVLSKQKLDAVEDLMDEIIKDSILTYAAESKKYLRVSHLNKDNNTFVLEFLLGVNTYVICHYDKICYGDKINNINSDEGWVYMDIGVEIVGIANHRTKSKVGSGKYIYIYAKDCIPTMRYGYVELSYKLQDNKVIWTEAENIEFGSRDDIELLKRNFGRHILKHIGTELAKVCKDNPDIINNTNVADYVSYDKVKRDYIAGSLSNAALTIGGTVFIGAIAALGLAASADFLASGDFSSIMQLGSAQQIMSALCTVGGIGGLQGFIMAHKRTEKARNTNRVNKDILKNSNPKKRDIPKINK